MNNKTQITNIEELICKLNKHMQDNNLNSNIYQYNGGSFLLLENIEEEGQINEFLEQYIDDNEIEYNIDMIMSSGFSDEYATCHNCGEIVNTQVYEHRQVECLIVNECELLCKKCLDNNLDQFIGEFINNSNKAINSALFTEKELLNLEFEKVTENFENGLYKSMNDDPKSILNDFINKYPNKEFVFFLEGGSPYHAEFSLYSREL